MVSILTGPKITKFKKPKHLKVKFSLHKVSATLSDPMCLTLEPHGDRGEDVHDLPSFSWSVSWKSLHLLWAPH